MTKDSVLKILRKTDDYISGEKISLELGISRAAVNTAVKSLRQDGYDILSSTNRGYKLTTKEKQLRAGEICVYLDRSAETLVCLPTVGSTNEHLKKLAADGAPSGTVVIADEQTLGKGRRGRRFASPAGTGLYLSYLLRPSVPARETSSVSALASVALTRVLARDWGVAAQVKWVNDLVINGRKIAGILTEMAVEAETGHVEYLIIGIGINLNSKITDFPSEIQDMVGSVYSQTGVEIDRVQFAAKLVEELDKLGPELPLDFSEYLSEYRTKCINTGKDVKIISGEKERIGKVLDINDDFSLKIKFADGSVEDVFSGEVSVRGLYGYT